MKKNSGIIRNKFPFLLEAKTKIQRKKHRFQTVNKNDQSFETSTPSSTIEQGIMMSSTASIENDEQACKAVYDKAKSKLHDVSNIQKKISVQAKARLSSFKQKQNERYDENISKLASQATNLLLQAQKCLKQMNGIQPKNESDKKLIQNMSQSLALEIREVSRELRQQEKQYFDTIRAYEKNTKNTAIELSQEQRIMMKGLEQEQMQEQKNDLLNNKKIDELVKNINKLSTIYKELNSLVIEQGSLIDRIDVNIDSTLTHTKKAVVHLEAADEHASSPFADKVMKILVVMIMILAVLLGLKWMA